MIKYMATTIVCFENWKELIFSEYIWGQTAVDGMIQDPGLLYVMQTHTITHHITLILCPKTTLGPDDIWAKIMEI